MIIDSSGQYDRSNSGRITVTGYGGYTIGVEGTPHYRTDGSLESLDGMRGPSAFNFTSENAMGGDIEGQDDHWGLKGEIAAL